MVALEVRNLGKRFGGLAAIDDLSFDVFSSEILGLIGPNGAGKSTLFNVINGFYRPTTGKVLFNGIDITGLKPYQVAQVGIGTSFQAPTLFMESSVFDNVFVAFHMHFRIARWKAFLHMPAVKVEESSAKQRTMEILEFMGLASVKDKLASSLPHGQQKALGVCMGLAIQPRLLLLDEPMTGMNPTEALVMIDLVRKIRDKRITVLMVEHNMKVVMDLCDRIVVMNYGRKLAEGLPQEIQNNKNVIEAYLGRSH
jgi:branched-chain amino acid transport system ATP-binding protein